MKKLYIVTIFCIFAMLTVPVIAGGDYENKYVDNNPKYSILPMDSYGNIEFFIRACGSAQDLTIWVAPVKANLTFDPAWNPDGSNIEGQNLGFKQVEVQPDCLSIPEQYPSGEFVAYLQQGNGNQLETRYFKVGGGGTDRVSFLGAGVTTAKNYCDHRYHILSATYGNGECYYITVTDEKEWWEDVWHPEVNHTVTIVDREGVPGWTEEIYHPEINHTVHHDEVSHQKWIEDGHYYIHDWKWFVGSGWKVKCSNHAEHGEGWHHQTSACTESYGHWITVIDSPAWDEIIVDKEAWTEYVEHEAIPAITHEEIVVDEQEWMEHIFHPAVTHQELVCNDILDVTDLVQEVVNGGNLKFYFDNTVVPGGIFAEGGELLVTIEDPAPQYPKTAFITYEDRCGNSQRVKEYTVSGGEGVMFDLVAGIPGCSITRKK